MTASMNAAQFAMKTGRSPKRVADTDLANIDRALEAFEEAEPGPAVLMQILDLHSLINSWVSLYHASLNKGTRLPSTIDTSQYKIVMELYEIVVAQLSRMLAVPENQPHQLTNKLRAMFGCDVSEELQKYDSEARVERMDALERELTRLTFQGGLIHRFAFATDTQEAGSYPLNTAPFMDTVNRGGGAPLPGFAPFVLTHDWNFYIAKHHTTKTAIEDAKKNNLDLADPKLRFGFYHTSYVDGLSVAAAGTMRIDNGKLVAIRSDSGHYKPSTEKLISALRAFKAKGIDIRDVYIINYDSDQADMGINGANAMDATINSGGQWRNVPDAMQFPSHSAMHRPPPMIGNRGAVQGQDMGYAGDAKKAGEYIVTPNSGYTPVRPVLPPTPRGAPVAPMMGRQRADSQWAKAPPPMVPNNNGGRERRLSMIGIGAGELARIKADKQTVISLEEFSKKIGQVLA